MSPATDCVASALMSVTATLAPSAANTRAVARPMPLAAPVTTTVRPLTERLSRLKSDMMRSGQEREACCRIDKAGTDPQTGQTMSQARPNKKRNAGMNELDFSGKQVLVVGGSSGIGNGIAHAFRAKGARVAVCGTRASAADYSPDDGSHLEGLDYLQLDVSKPHAVEALKPPFEKLDVLVLAQGAVIYRRGE